MDIQWIGWMTILHIDPDQIFQLLCSGCNKRIKPRATPKDIPIDKRPNLFNRILHDMITHTITRGGLMKKEKVSSQPLQKVIDMEKRWSDYVTDLSEEQIKNKLYCDYEPVLRKKWEFVKEDDCEFCSYLCSGDTLDGDFILTKMDFGDKDG